MFLLSDARRKKLRLLSEVKKQLLISYIIGSREILVNRLYYITTALIMIPVKNNTLYNLASAALYS